MMKKGTFWNVGSEEKERLKDRNNMSSLALFRNRRKTTSLPYSVIAQPYISNTYLK